MKGKLIKETFGGVDHYTLFTDCELIPYAKDGSGHGYMKLSLKNCEAITNGFDLEDLSEKCSDEFADVFDYNDGHGNIKRYSNTEIIQKVYISGFQKALEIIGDKKFSEEDVMKAFVRGQEMEVDYFSYKQSLQPKEWDISFNPVEKDYDGCLILKRES